MTSMTAQAGLLDNEIVALVMRRHPINGDVKGAKMEFKSQYKHPLWQKKRLEALNDKKFTCERCYDDSSQLHVHHKQYFKGRMIWEYSLSELEVLCFSCHEEAHSNKDIFQLVASRLKSDSLVDAAALLCGFYTTERGPNKIENDAIADSLKDNFFYQIGVLSQSASRINNIDAIIELASKLKEMCDCGGVVSIDLPAPAISDIREVDF
ncbi:MAG: HNH endonuclease [Thiobacillus sp.]